MEWISIKDRWPKCDTPENRYGVVYVSDDVLIWDKDHAYVGKATSIDGKSDFSFECEWIDSAGTHWMQIPEPPKD